MVSKCCILTAAHCVSGTFGERQFNTSNSTSLKVCLGRRSGDCNVGKHRNKKEQQSEQVQCFHAHRILVHRDYNETTFAHDIAIIQPETSKCLQCRAASVKPVCLPRAKRDINYLTPGTRAWVTGWGTSRPGGDMSATLRKGKIKLVDQGECKAFFAQATNPATLTEDQICARDDAGPCQGDSGGPLMVKTSNNSYVLVGLISWGRGCGMNNSFGVYSGILYHLDWIYDSCSRWN